MSPSLPCSLSMRSAVSTISRSDSTAPLLVGRRLRRFSSGTTGFGTTADLLSYANGIDLV